MPLPSQPPRKPNQNLNQNPSTTPQTGYSTVAALTADSLLYGTSDKIDELQPTIIRIRDWLQDYITQHSRDEEIAAARIDSSKRIEMAQELDRLLIQYLAKESVSKGEDRGIIVASVINEILGLGPIEPLWTDKRITEVMVNGPTKVYVEIGGKLQLAKGAKFRDQEHLLQVCQQILTPLNRRVDQKFPLADGRLSDGSRVNIVHTSIAPSGPCLTIRRFPETIWTLKDLVENGSVTEEMACTLAWLIQNKTSALVVGGTGSGKAISHSETIATPSGMTTMGDLKVGDQVLDENGVPCNVTGKFEQKNPSVFEVVFSDGSIVVTDGDHNWWTSTRASRRSKARGLQRDLVRQSESRMDNDEVCRVKDWVNTLPADALISSLTYNRNFPEHQTVFNAFIRYHGKKYVLPEKQRLAGDRCKTNVYDAHILMDRWIDYIQCAPKDQRSLRTFEEVRTTREIMETLRTTNGHTNHAVRMIPGPITVWPRRDLIVDPYVMGAWLGDGDSHHGIIAIEEKDKEIDGYIAEHYQINRKNKYIIQCYGLSRDLNNYGLIAKKSVRKYGDTKHIPEDYLYSSVEQRRALMAGMLDTDGTVSRDKGTVEFANSNYALIEGFRTLAHSLGYQTTVRSKIPTYTHNGEKLEGKKAYTVEFASVDDVFRLSRKNELHRQVRSTAGQKGDRSRLRYIVDVRPVFGPAPQMACITVDSPNHLYLCSDAFIPTHNTSLLNALSSCIPRTERVVTVEDVLELRLHPESNLAALQARPPSASGDGEVKIRALVKNALRMRPDRIVVGEVRDSSALDMLQAMNTGHEGSMTTVHANGPDEAINRLSVLVAEGGEIPENKVQWLIGDAIDILVLQRRYEDGSRRVQGIYEIPSMTSEESSDGFLKPVPLWEWKQTDSTEDGKFIGEYVKRNEISERLIEAHRLKHTKKLTMDDVNRMSEIPVE